MRLPYPTKMASINMFKKTRFKMTTFVIMRHRNGARQHKFHSTVQPREDIDGVRRPPYSWLVPTLSSR